MFPVPGVITKRLIEIFGADVTNWPAARARDTARAPKGTTGKKLGSRKAE